MQDYCKIEKKLKIQQVLMSGVQPESLHFETTFCVVPMLQLCLVELSSVMEMVHSCAAWHISH